MWHCSCLRCAACRWEYERASSPEAQLCKDFDKIEMIMQAAEYEAAQHLTLQDFFDSTEGKWKTEQGCDMATSELATVLHCTHEEVQSGRSACPDANALCVRTYSTALHCCTVAKRPCRRRLATEVVAWRQAQQKQPSTGD
jgi:hypothetical protein